DQAGSINWAMGMAARRLGNGRLTLRGMISLETPTIGDCGYPALLSTGNPRAIEACVYPASLSPGEQSKGETIHDRQHPHDLFMELAAAYDRPLAGGIRWQVYGGPGGGPVVGPTAVSHRH